MVTICLPVQCSYQYSPSFPLPNNYFPLAHSRSDAKSTGRELERKQAWYFLTPAGFFLRLAGSCERYSEKKQNKTVAWLYIFSAAINNPGVFHLEVSGYSWNFCNFTSTRVIIEHNGQVCLQVGTRRAQTFLACQQEELLVQRGLLLHLSHVFQGQEFIRRGGVRALIQSCHYDGERVRPNTDVHPTRKRRPLHEEARHGGGGDNEGILFLLAVGVVVVLGDDDDDAASQRSRGLASWDRINVTMCRYCRRIFARRYGICFHPPLQIPSVQLHNGFPKRKSPSRSGENASIMSLAGFSCTIFSHRKAPLGSFFFFGPDAADEAPTAHARFLHLLAHFAGAKPPCFAIT